MRGAECGERDAAFGERVWCVVRWWNGYALVSAALSVTQMQATIGR